ncbi:AMP-binding protein [Saccharopolyspora sp. NPDC002686]|uniref:AMP-binding protein n=1 Tax=Saccharopolyspora sp. NPDC002686 TaxID=3154541 RepID=UPI00332DFD14
MFAHEARHHDDEELLLAVVRTLAAERRPPDAVAAATLDSDFERDLGLDSLALAELLGRVERTFGVKLQEGVLSSIETPRDLLQAVRGASGAGGLRDTGGRSAPPRAAQGVPAAATTLTEALSWHVQVHPDRQHVRVLRDDDDEILSFGDLHRSAAVVAAGLQARGVRPRDTVALMLPTSGDYFTSFTGVLLAGGIPVPIYPPARPSQLADHLRRQVSILDNARAAALITEPAAARFERLVRSHVPSLRNVLTPAELHDHGQAGPVDRGPADVALLQYTSGSTGNPKGVVLTHANLLSNIRAMAQAARVSTSDVFISWLPLYHDMGLIGAWLSCLYLGHQLVIMPPSAFLTRPARWLWAIHTHRGTLSAAPNFAYELCLREIDRSELDGLDLSSWRIAFNGAEPVHADTLHRFTERFQPYGFQPAAMVPAYGLAEACVGLTFPPAGRGPVVDRVARAEFERSGQALPAASDDPDPLAYVACGIPLVGHEIRIVSRTGSELGDRQEGRIEFRGPSATQGYFRNPQETHALIRHGWLDTGDLGYLDAGELYVTGRVKDLIIRAGRNLHPEELEAAVGDLPGIRNGCVVAFASTGRGDEPERFIVIAETPQTEPAVLAGLRERITATAIDLFDVAPDDVVLAPLGSVPKTPSGKIRRTASRESYERGTISAPPRSLSWQRARSPVIAAIAWSRRTGQLMSVAIFTAWCWFLAVAIGGPTVLAAALLPRAAPAIARQAARSLARLTGTHLIVTGAEQLTRTPSSIVVANHASYLDDIALIAALPGRCTFVAAEVLATRPAVGFLLRRLGTLFVERTDREQGITDTDRLTRAAREGQQLVIHPEGGLSSDPGLRPFHAGAFIAAARSGRPVIPVALHGTRDILKPGNHHFRHHNPVHVTIGEPIQPRAPGWDTAIELEHRARAMIAEHCGEPDRTQ